MNTANSKDRDYLEKIGKEYNAITATAYYQHYLSRRKLIISKFLKELVSDNGVIADLASGVGNYTENISNYRLLLNLDLSLNSLMEQRFLKDNIVRINADALHVPLKNNSVNCVLLVGLMHHIPDNLHILFEEVKRILKKGGVVIIDEANAYNLAWFIVMKLSRIDRIGTRPLFPFYLKKLACDFDFSIKKELYWGLVPPGVKSNSIINTCKKIERSAERSFLNRICARYTLVLMKQDDSNEN